MRLRPVLTTLSATALLTASLAAVPAANAASPSTCRITDFSPREIVVGAGWSGVAPFRLKTTCPVEEDVNWYVTVHNGPPGPYGWLIRANHYQPPWSRYSWVPDGVVAVGGLPNSYAGTNDIFWDAFVGEGGTARSMHLSSTIQLKRGTTFYDHPATHPSIEPETVAPGGPLTISGTLYRADWEAGQYESGVDGFAAPVVVQFRHDDASKYSDVTTVQTAADGSFTTTVKAPKRSGTWRVVYRGDAESGASKTLEDHVVVTTR